MDMEFVQFHPTGMVWPPSVKGILVTEGVRGEGGVLKNSAGKRFMFDDIPENYRGQTADSEEEGWRYTQGDKSARRPPELLTRDHVARCINREVKAGRGSPHGGVFLDIAWIREKLGGRSVEHIKKKLPSMYHQFKELADLDITQTPMEVGPTTHYVMGGVRVDGDSQMSTVPGLFAAGECAAGLHGANRLGGNSLSDLIVFGKLAGEHAAAFAKQAPASRVKDDDVAAAADAALAPLHRQGGDSPYKVQSDLQALMQEQAGIVRNGTDLADAVVKLDGLKQRAATVSAGGNREYNPGWHTALDLPNLLIVSEAVARAGLLREESRGAHFREDKPAKDPAWGKVNLVMKKGADGRMEIAKRAVPALTDEQKKIIEEIK
jgi:succinate dehydrogenase / fumarate reductase flavoprotein subunit